MTHYNLIFILFLCLIACNNASKTKSENSENSFSEEEESDWLLNLYTNYVDDPKTQDQIDENLLINYIVEKQIPAQRTESGLYYHIVKKGEGELFKKGDPVTAHYSGYFFDGKIFDSSYQRGEPIKFKVGQMNAGWNEGLLLLNKGSKAKLLLPSKLGYGKRGFPGFIEPNMCLVFDLEILE